jgi:hypothetical protein
MFSRAYFTLSSRISSRISSVRLENSILFIDESVSAAAPLAFDDSDR